MENKLKNSTYLLKNKENINDYKNIYVEGKINVHELNDVLNRQSENDVVPYDYQNYEDNQKNQDNQNDESNKNKISNKQNEIIKLKNEFKNCFVPAFFIAFCTFLFLYCICTPIEKLAITDSTKNRNKITNVIKYDQNCISDELGYVESTQELSKNLKEFYKETGVQPYIYLKENDGLINDKQKKQFAKKYYDENIKNENSFLFVYFENNNPKTRGYIACVTGKNAQKVMDKEAINIFKDYIIFYGTNSSKSSINTLTKIYDSTANKIMKKDIAFMDAATYSSLGAIIVAILYIKSNYSKYLEAKNAIIQGQQEVQENVIDNSTNSSDINNIYINEEYINEEHQNLKNSINNLSNALNNYSNKENKQNKQNKQNKRLNVFKPSMEEIRENTKNKQNEEKGLFDKYFR